METGLIPLNIPDVLATVMSYLRLEELKVCRLVCRQWMEEASKVMAPQCCLKMFDSADDMEEATSLVSYSKRAFNKESLWVDRNTSNIRVIDSETTKLMQSRLRLLSLFQIVGNNVVHFECSYFFIHNDEFLCFLTDSLPNLKSLCFTSDFSVKPMELMEFARFSHTRRFPKFLNVKHLTVKANEVELEELVNQSLLININPVAAIVYLMKMLPALETLSYGPLEYSQNFLTRFMDETTPEINICPRLKKFLFNVYATEIELLELMGRNLHLQYLDITVRTIPRTPQLYEFLTTLGSTLEELRVDLSFPPHHSLDKFTCAKSMIKLRKLTLVHYSGDITFVLDIPNLEVLILDKTSVSSTFSSPCYHQSNLLELTITRLSGDTGQWLPYIAKHVAISFPYLRKLDVERFNDSSLTAFLECCHLIEDLRLKQSSVSDSSLTGLPSPVCSQVLALIENEQNENTASIPMINNCKSPQLSSLPKLKYLQLEAPRITDVSLIFGITKCNNLRKLCIASPNISLLALNKVRKQSKMRNIGIHNCFRIDHEVKFVYDAPENSYHRCHICND